MSLRRARSAEEYAEWVKQAMFEVGDLKDCLLYEVEDLQRFPAYIEPLEEGIKQVYDAMVEGTYHFGREDLLYMDVLRRYEDEIPFHTLLKQINETHRRGRDPGRRSASASEQRIEVDRLDLQQREISLRFLRRSHLP